MSEPDQMERTLVIIKPDAIQRRLAGEIIHRFERKGLRIIAMKMIKVDLALAERHYGEHKGKPFYEPLVSFITSGPVVPMVWEGENAVALGRSMMGKTDPQSSRPGTLKGDFGLNLSRNVIHGSDSPESATREIGIFFSSGEILEYSRIDEEWLYP